jgi:DNA polymerase/3'-5' exonuclease PolX
MSIFWKNLTIKQLKEALKARERELQSGYSKRREAEARRAIKHLEKEIERRKLLKTR